MDDDSLFELHAGSADSGGVVEIQTQKFNYPADHPGFKTLDAIGNLKAKAAWLAFESGNDVVLARKSPWVMSHHTLSGLARSLDDNGLMDDYEGFDFPICRLDEWKGLPSHPVLDNPVRGSDPVAVVRKPLDDSRQSESKASEVPAFDLEEWRRELNEDLF